MQGHAAGNGETYALVTAGAGKDRGVDAEKLSIQINKRSARVAGIDGRIGLDEIFISVYVEP